MNFPKFPLLFWWMAEDDNQRLEDENRRLRAENKPTRQDEEDTLRDWAEEDEERR